MKKTYLLIGLVIVLVGGYFMIVRKAETVDRDLMPVRIGYNAESITNAAMMIAYEQNYFQEHGVFPQMVPLKSGREVMQAMAAGQVDLGIGGFANFAQAMAKGAPVRYIAASASSPSFVFVRPNENLRSFTDLYGKIISASFGGINDLIFRTAMRREDIDTSRMQFTDIERAYQVAALIDKKAIDAIVVSEQDTEGLLGAGAVALPEWQLKGYDKKSEPRNSIVVNSEFLDQQERAVEGALDALIDAHYLIGGSPAMAAEIVAKHIQEGSSGAVIHTPENIAKQWTNKDIVNMIWQDPGVIMKLAQTAREMGIIDKELAVGDIYDLRFKDKLAAAQEAIYGETD